MNTTTFPLIFQIKQLPDLNSQKYVSVHGQNARAKLLAYQNKFLLLLTEICQVYQLSFSLRYLYLPQAKFNEKLKIYLVLSSSNTSSITPDVLKILHEKLPIGFIDQFYELKLIEPLEKVKYDSFFDSISELKYLAEAIKYEEVIHSYNGNFFYYAPLLWETDENNDMSVVCEAITSFDSPLMLEITLRPYTVSDSEKNKWIKAVNRVINDLKQLSNPGWSKRDNDTKSQEDSTTRLFLRIYEKYQSYAVEELYQYTFRVLGEDELALRYILKTFLLSGTKKGNYRTLIFNNQQPEFISRIKEIKEGELSPAYWKAWDEDNTLSGLSSDLKPLFRLVALTEVSGLFRIVVPGNAPVKGIKQENSIESPPEDVSIDFGGHEFNSPENTIRIKLEQLNKHAFICGVPGSGKTTTSFNFLTQLWLKDIPFLVFESAKTEYRSLLQIQPLLKSDENPHGFNLEQVEKLESFKTELRVYTLGNEQISPFRFNPFEVSEAVPFYEHISNLEASFRGALPLFGPLPALLSEALEEIYYDRDWDGSEVGTPEDKKDKIPTMRDLYAKINDLMESKNYAGEVKSNIKAALEVRVGSLVRRGIGLILNTTKSCPTIEELLKYPTILELDYLNQDQANLMTFFLLTKIREYVKRDKSRVSQSGPPAHVILLEEAHNIVGRNLGNTSSEEANTKKEAANYITRMLAEMRALRESIIVIDQLPTAVAFEVIKNTNVKIAHRLVSTEDRKDIGSSMLLNNSQMEEIARLNPGQSFLYMEGWYRPVLVNIPREKSAKVKLKVESSCTDDDITSSIKQKEWYKKGQEILSSTKGTSEVFEEKCLEIINNLDDELNVLNNKLTLIKQELNCLENYKNSTPEGKLSEQDKAKLESNLNNIKENIDNTKSFIGSILSLKDNEYYQKLKTQLSIIGRSKVKKIELKESEIEQKLLLLNDNFNVMETQKKGLQANI